MERKTGLSPEGRGTCLPGGGLSPKHGLGKCQAHGWPKVDSLAVAERDEIPPALRCWGTWERENGQFR